jgi:hypothetical protein
MAISVLYQPQVFSPAYNRNEYGLDSTNSTETGFRYVVDVYDAGTSNKVAEYRVRPQDATFEGIIDIRKILTTKLSFNFDPTVTLFISNNDQTWYEYDIKFGEEYAVDYAYTGFNDNGGYVRLTGVDPHSFVAGDQINLTESTPGTNPLLTGLHTIISQTVNTLTIDVIYADLVSPTSIAGDVVYADNRKTIFRDLATVNGQIVFNGAFNWMDFKNYNLADYVLNSVTDKFLTDLPDEFTTTPSAEMYVNVYNQKSAAVEYMMFENSDGDILYKQITNSADEVTIIPVGAGNNGATFATVGLPPLIKSTTTWYKFWYADNTFTRVSQEYLVNLDRRCEIEPFEILFLDRKGSMMPFAFNLKTQEKVTVERTLINQRVNGFDGGANWNYDTFEAGEIAVSTEIDKEYELNTNWMTQSDNEYFEQLVTSPKTLIKMEDGNWYSCIVQDKEVEVVRQRGKKLIRKTVKIKLSNKDVVNG